MKLEDLTRYLNDYLKVQSVPDYPSALNGLQVANSGNVQRIAVAVDAAQVVIERAIELGTDLLIVHHGLFWDGNQPVTDRRYRRLKALLDADMAVYSAHLPLDAHPEVGNNAVLAKEIGIEIQGTLGDYKGVPIGVWGNLEITRGSLAERLSSVLKAYPHVVPGGPELIRTVGLITGGSGQEVNTARAQGLDAFITGEGAHHNFFDAEEGGINLFLGGHYATETWGVRALGAHIEDKFGIACTFIDHPTGL